jgi:exonuclease III
MKQLELENIHIQNYTLGARYGRKTLEKGGVSIFVKNLKFTKTNLEDYCKDQDLEACALKLDSTFYNICILTLYRAPSGNFDHFLNRLENILNVLHSPKAEFVICGDINVNYLIEYKIILDQR